jgi:hypothetical protein
MPLPYYNQRSQIQNRQKDKWYHNVGEFVLDPRNIGTAVGSIWGSPGAAVGSALGGMLPGVDFGPEDDARQSSLGGGVGEAVGGVTRDAARGYGAAELGQMGVDKLQGAFADPLTAQATAQGAGVVPGPTEFGLSSNIGGADPLMAQGAVGGEASFMTTPDFGGAGVGGGGMGADALAMNNPNLLGFSGLESGGIDAAAATENLSQSAANAANPDWLREMMEKQGKMSTLEKAFLISQIMGTAANIQGGLSQQRQYQQSRGPGNPFDLAMADAFGQDRNRSGVSSYQDYIKRVG